MFSATFMFNKKQFDADFYRLDKAIAEIAQNTLGYLGEEAWENSATGLVSNVYYWQTIEGLHELMNHPTHQEAKTKQRNWLNGYQVIIAEVLRAYGDGSIIHPTSSLHKS